MVDEKDERESLEDEEDGEEDGEDEPKKKRLSGKQLVLFGAVPLLVIGLGVGAAFYFGLLGGHGEDGAEVAEQAPEEADIDDVVFFDLPEILVTLNASGRSANYLKMKVSLELTDKDALDRLEALMPRIVDNFQVYLRELRLEDLNGSAGLFRLKEELLTRVNAAVHPARVNDVLFREMLVQ